MKTRLSLGLCGLLALAACRSIAGTAGFELDRGPSSRDDLGPVIARIANANSAAVPAVAVVLPPSPAQGFSVFELPSGRRLSQVSARIDTRPIIVGDVILSHVQGMVVAWSLDGTERWRAGDDGLSLNAAARDGDHIAITLGGNGLSTHQGALLVVDASSGHRVSERRIAHALGQPAMAGNDLFVPWDGQNVSVFDVDSDQEIARVRSRDVMALCVREGSAVYLGGRGLYRLSPAAAENGLTPPPEASDADAGAASTPRPTSATRWALPRADLPGNTPFSIDPYTTVRSGMNARERVRALWRPDPARPDVAMTDGKFYSLFYRALFGMDATTGAIQWGYLHTADIVSAEVVRGGVVFVDEQGNIAMVDQATGARRWGTSLNAAAQQVVLQLPMEFTAGSTGADANPTSAVERLLAVAGDSDTRLMPAQLFAVKGLAESTSADATRALVAIVTHPSNTQDLRAAAGEALTHRTSGGYAITEALSARYDYLRQPIVPPSGLLARALASSHEQSGVAALVAHLNDPATRAADVADIAAALRDLGDPAALPALQEFLRLYHADFGEVTPPGGGDAIDERADENSGTFLQALGAVAEAIARIGGNAQLASIDDAISDQRTPRDLRATLAGARSGHSTAGTAGTPSTGGGGSSEPSSMVVGVGALAQSQIDEAFAPVRPRLLECLRSATSRPAQVRIQFRYDTDGRITHPSIGRAEFQQCMGEIVTGVQLPTSTAGTEIGTFYLQVIP